MVVDRCAEVNIYVVSVCGKQTELHSCQNSVHLSFICLFLRFLIFELISIIHSVYRVNSCIARPGSSEGVIMYIVINRNYKLKPYIVITLIILCHMDFIQCI